jgi:hypothetical protein
MANSAESLEPGEAHDALESVEPVERDTARQAVGPRWLSAAIALLAGGLFAAQALDPSDRSVAYVLAIVGIAILLSYGRDTNGAALQAYTERRGRAVTALAIAGFALLLLSLFVVAIVLRDRFDLGWAPLPVGAVVAALLFAVDESTSRAYLAKHGAERGA